MNPLLTQRFRQCAQNDSKMSCPPRCLYEALSASSSPLWTKRSEPARRCCRHGYPPPWMLCLHPLLRPSDGRLLLLRPCRRSHVCRAWPFGGSLKTRGCQLGRHGGNRASRRATGTVAAMTARGRWLMSRQSRIRPASPGRWAAPCSTVALVQRLPLARAAGNR